MDPRRRKAVVLAGITPTLGASGMMLTQHYKNSRFAPEVIGGWIVMMMVPLALSLRYLYELKKDGNPY